MNFGNTGKPRVEDRVSAKLSAPMRDSIGERIIKILDVSSRGLLATAEQPPRRGDFVELRIGNTWLAGHVRWVGGQRFGLSLQERINTANVIAGAQAGIRVRRRAAAAPEPRGLFGRLRSSF